MYTRIKDEQYTTSLTFSQVYLQDDFMITNADEWFYDFLGKNSKLFFNQLIHPEYEHEFLEVASKVSFGEEYRLVTLIKDHEDIYHPVHMIMRPIDINLGEHDKYVIDVYGLDIIEKTYLTSQQSIDKYQSYMGLSGDVFFEYSPDNNNVVIYDFVELKKNILYENHIDKWYSDCLQYAADTGSNLAEIDCMYQHLKAGDDHFNATIKTGILNANHAHETLYINAKRVYRHNMDTTTAIVRRDVSEDDVPYYLTEAGKDSATRLLNKRAIIDYTNDCLAVCENKKLYMVLIDIDDFKTINDTYGHLAGDKAILALAETLVEVLGSRGIVGRFGGDEFYILTEDIPDEAHLRIFLKSVVAKLKVIQAKQLGGVTFTLSMGVSQYPESGKNFNAMFTLADKALYIAKEKGKNRYIIYRPELHDNIDVTGLHGEVNSSGSLLLATNKACKKLLASGRSALNIVLNDIRKSFEIDTITIHYGENLQDCITSGDCPSGLLDISFIKTPGYGAMFFDENMVAVNEVANIERVDKQVYERISVNRCSSYIQLTFPTFTNVDCVISFYIFDRKHKWSDMEKSYIEILANVIKNLL